MGMSPLGQVWALRETPGEQTHQPVIGMSGSLGISRKGQSGGLGTSFYPFSYLLPNARITSI